MKLIPSDLVLPDFLIANACQTPCPSFSRGKQLMTQYYSEHSKVWVSVDCIVFGFENNQLKLLIGRRQMDPGRGEWSLYGGFVRDDEGLDEAANRVLYSLTGLKEIYMKQVERSSRRPRSPVNALSRWLTAHSSMSTTTTTSCASSTNPSGRDSASRQSSTPTTTKWLARLSPCCADASTFELLSFNLLSDGFAHTAATRL